MSSEEDGMRNIAGPVKQRDPCPHCGRPLKEHKIEWHDGARYTFCPGAVRTAYVLVPHGSRELLAEFLAAVAALSSEAEGLEHQVEQEYGLPSDPGYGEGCKEAQRVDELLPKVAEEFGIPVASRSHEDENRA